MIHPAAIRSFRRTLGKTAEELYSPLVAAHEAGHARTQQSPGWRAVRQTAPIVGRMLAGAEMASRGMGFKAQGFAQLGAAALTHSPVIADELMASLIAAREGGNTLTKEERARALRQLVALQSTYAVGAVADTAAALTTLSGFPVVPAVLRSAGRVVTGVAGSRALAVGGPKVDAEQAAEIVHAIAPGTPVFVTRSGVPGGSLYLPKPDTAAMRSVVDIMTPAFRKTDLKVLREHGGVLLAPLQVPKNAPEKLRFRRVDVVD